MTSFKLLASQAYASFQLFKKKKSHVTATSVSFQSIIPGAKKLMNLFSSRYVHITILLNCAVFTQRTNNGRKLLQLVN